MKAVLISIQPKWCEMICQKIGEENGKPIYRKRIEVRKGAPIELPFKAYIYQTKKRWIYKLLPWLKKKQGKVIGEFVCDKVDTYHYFKNLTKFDITTGLPIGTYESYLIFEDDYKSMCLTYDELKNYGKGKTLYGWHISDLKIYDEPKRLGEFLTSSGTGGLWGNHYLSRPPQSWCYVEELK